MSRTGFQLPLLPGRSPSEPPDTQDRTRALEAKGASEQVGARVRRLFGGSFHLRHVDAGSCNACESELKALANPYYDLHRLGIFIEPSPRHADGLIVTGPITLPMREPLLRTYEAMPEPRLVIAVGTCACTGGIFAGSELVAGPLERLLPVDVYIPGCPPSPLTLLHGLLLALGRVEEARR
ncbi:MAG: NADH-quinone oxidoreductase subunit B family protein [Chloroflexi bacterium]|nr:NADH-quinone oxidoreductase subunit B family protein [Chloroflexota bacterium]